VSVLDSIQADADAIAVSFNWAPSASAAHPVDGWRRL
jgi:hypothetical protein